MNPLKQLNPQLSKLAAQVIYAKHQEQAQREVAQIRQVLLAMMREGATVDELVKVVMAADPGRFTNHKDKEMG